MKRSIALILAPWAMTAMLFGIAPDSLMQRANSAYAAGDHNAALALYDSLHRTHTSAALLYNIGNCHFKLNDVGRAILFYERAIRMEPGAEDIQANLDLARQQVVDRVSEPPGIALGGTWARLRSGNDVDHWARRALVLCAALFILLGISLFLPAGGFRQVLRGLAIISALSTAVAMGLAGYRSAEVRNADSAIIMMPKVDARSAPQGGGTVLFVLHEGTKVQVLQEQAGWTEIRLPNGNVGWLPPDAVERI